MATDVLILGGFAFEDFSVPNEMPGGGNQAMVVHKLPGGSRVIDTLGPDDAPVAFTGQMFADNAFDQALALDAMRVAGEVIPLIWGGQTKQVVIEKFTFKVKRLPNWVTYDISCVVAQDPTQGDLTAVDSSVDSNVSSDLSSASSAATDPFGGAAVPAGTPPI
ncbi:hypothetical protein HU675_0038180 [Bradyrhizobium septentrionale]|uniref:hypothetical protein n=1 Tax=Bradyrhizobium septentrionale TaxID=1404411 RepID=UPI001596BE46|nr:hypothetical protein [Bradyrhizobium septentrionale]UGY23715.1 hypothetical protein HU675_0038180 [Bradyrhizobium septentrionale]